MQLQIDTSDIALVQPAVVPEPVNPTSENRKKLSRVSESPITPNTPTPNRRDTSR